MYSICVFVNYNYKGWMFQAFPVLQVFDILTQSFLIRERPHTLQNLLLNSWKHI